MFVKAIVSRLAKSEDLPRPRIDIGSARGGHGKAVAELKLFQRTTSGHAHDALIIVIDADKSSWNTIRGELDQVVDRSGVAYVIIWCPDPHIERWYLADPPSLMAAFGVDVKVGDQISDRKTSKSLLKQSLQAAGHDVRLGGIEFAEEIVECMDLFNAGKNEPSLKHFLDDVRSVFREIALGQREKN